MKINWKVRFKNKVWLTSFITLIVSFIYSMLNLFDVIPAIAKNDILQVINEVLMFLGMIGVVVDPTTEGLGDSKRALSYEEPWVDPPADDIQNEQDQ